ncbi:hypothetical protein ACMD2_23662 [Ananas comosus]|uniref:Uncharacterized protein n=1 Tax=Ananas comosus TaxID=4615 RepID=A0A199UHY3_ANACO|nr:hypothetical protein ACMD2_23662 [Ananas comosus]
MRRYDDDGDDDLSRAIDDLYALLSAVLRRPQRKASNGGTPPPLAGLAGLLLGASLTLVIGGSLLLVIGVVLMPVLVAVILAGIFSTISERGRGIISPSKMPHKEELKNTSDRSLSSLTCDGNMKICESYTANRMFVFLRQFFFSFFRGQDKEVK